MRMIPTDPDVFPEDCMHFMESIDVMPMGDFRPGAMVEVIIGEVYSPSQFWFIRLGENYNMAMEDMMDDMTRYYRNEGKDRVLARGAIRVGHYCSSVFEKDWHRSVIVKIIDTDTVKVRHVDYGTVDTVSVGSLKPLRRSWGALPAQACRARLGGVRPSAAGWRWPHAASAAFLQLVSGRRLVANVVALDERDRVAEVLLIDTAGADDVCIGSELVRAGHADARRDSALRTLDVYLYPRFEALESGAAPNYAEVHAYLRDGIALDYVSAYRDHVPVPTELPGRHASPPASPPASPSTDRSASPPADPSASDVDEATLVTEVATRIPLFLPETTAASNTEPTAASSADVGPERGVSALSPDAPAYVPGAGAGRSPPPPYAPGGGGGVTLSLSECETYRVLSHVNPAAAHWFMVGALGRAMAVPVHAGDPAPQYPPAPPPPPPQTHRLPSPQMYPPPPLQMYPPPPSQVHSSLPSPMHLPLPLPPHMHPPPPPQMHPGRPSQMYPPLPSQMFPPPPSQMHPPVRMRPPPGFGI